MARLSELRKQAKEMGISRAVILRATTAAALQSVISDHESHGSKPRKKSAGRPVKKAGRTVAKKSTTRTTARRGNSGRKASTPAKSRKSGKAKRSSTTSGYEPKGGRNTLSARVNFNRTKGWNAREGSAPDRIIKALAKYDGDREKVYKMLVKKVWDFVGKTKANGKKRTQAEAEAMLRYRISRTAWDFAMRTNQHEPADNRVEYGTGGTGEGTWKPAKAKKAAKKAPARKPARKAPKAVARRAAPARGRKPASRQKPAQRRTGVKVVATRKRGRPRAGSRR
jgi:hypothetical protein